MAAEDAAPTLSDEVGANHPSWSAVAKLHQAAKRDVVEALTRGECFIPSELRERMLALRWSSVLQPLCNDGRELLELLRARPGTSGTGVDFVATYTAAAADNARRLGIAADFRCGEIQTWLSDPPADVRPDLIFSSLGSLWWIKDLETYCTGLARLAAEEAHLVIWDLHPLIHTLGPQLVPTADYPIIRTTAIYEDGVRQYITPEAMPRLAETEARAVDHRQRYPAYCTLWGLGPILTCAATAGWRLLHFAELPCVYGERFLRELIDMGDGWFGVDRGMPALPLSFTALFTK